jgi:hypothetical protein
MPGALTTGSTVLCGHGGTVSTTSSAKLKVSGNAVLLKDGIANQSVSGCLTVVTPPPPGPVSTPCLSVTAVDSGEATKLKAGGKPVVLETLKGETDGKVANVTPQLLLSATAGQSKLKAT